MSIRSDICRKFATSQWLAFQRQQFINRAKFQLKRFQSTNAKAPEKKKTGIKALVSQYGYSALGVYLALSCVDFPLSFLVVHHVGADKVKQVQDDVFTTVKSWFGIKKPEPVLIENESNDHFQLGAKHEEPTSLQPLEPTEQTMWESIYQSPLFTEVIVAYALHKSLVFVRVPLTAAITPPIVAKLRSMGFQIGKQKITNFATTAATKKTGTNGSLVADKVISEKFGTKATKKQKWWSWFF